MDTKLKNYHKLTAVIVALVILLPSLAMMIIRPHYIRQQNKQENLSFTESGLLNQLVENCYVLYGEELQSKNNNTLSAYDMFFSTGETKTAESTSSETTDSQDYTDIDSVVYDMEEKYNDWQSDFSHLRTYLEYDVLDGESKDIIDTNRGSTEEKNSLYTALSNMRTRGVLDEDSEYAFAAIVEYNENGTVKSTSFLSQQKGAESQMLNEIAKQNPTEEFSDYYNFRRTFQKPQSRIYCFAMTNAVLPDFLESDYKRHFNKIWKQALTMAICWFCAWLWPVLSLWALFCFLLFSRCRREKKKSSIRLLKLSL